MSGSIPGNATDDMRTNLNESKKKNAGTLLKAKMECNLYFISFGRTKSPLQIVESVQC